VAAGEPLPLSQDALRIDGHAIEVRLYAEDPARDFAPSTGRVDHLRFPEKMPGARIDTGIRQGDAVTIHYDPMIAKLIVHGPDRVAALARLSRALAGTEVAGPATNLALLRAIAANTDFRRGELDTGFIARHADTLLASPGPAPRSALAAAVARLLLDLSPPVALAGADPFSPWNAPTAWRLNGDGFQDFVLEDGEAIHTLRAHPRADGFRLDLPDGPMEVSVSEAADGMVSLRLGGDILRARALRRGDRITVFIDGAAHGLRHLDPRAPVEGAGAAAGRILAPMPGKVLDVMVRPEQAVTRGAVLLVLEAMKVQMRITAPADGIVSAVLCAPGDLVEDGAELVSLA